MRPCIDYCPFKGVYTGFHSSLGADICISLLRSPIYEGGMKGSFRQLSLTPRKKLIEPHIQYRISTIDSSLCRLGNKSSGSF